MFKSGFHFRSGKRTAIFSRRFPILLKTLTGKKIISQKILFNFSAALGVFFIDEELRSYPWNLTQFILPEEKVKW